jgi:nitroimidazol reductase NimA-like FMN-containing flavoprotein (pyridoxamine 5'-phosphate oxidase superfamily)
MSDQLGPGAHTRLRRAPEKAAYDADTVFAILDEALFSHVAAVVDGVAMTLPTLHRREGRTLYVHASKSNALLRAALAAGRTSLTATLYDGLRLARSGFESSIAYRSVVVVGSTREVSELEEKRRVLNGFVDTVLEGRGSEVRAITEREINLTLVVAVEIEEAAAKVSEGPTHDEPEDAALPIWSGTVPARLVYGEPVPATDGAMDGGGVALPASVARLLGGR